MGVAEVTDTDRRPPMRYLAIASLVALMSSLPTPGAAQRAEQGQKVYVRRAGMALGDEELAVREWHDALVQAGTEVYTFDTAQVGRVVAQGLLALARPTADGGGGDDED